MQDIAKNLGDYSVCGSAGAKRKDWGYSDKGTVQYNDDIKWIIRNTLNSNNSFFMCTVITTIAFFTEFLLIMLLSESKTEVGKEEYIHGGYAIDEKK